MQLQLTNVTFSYKDAPATLFADVSASFPVGWTGIVGANGSGKTTLLRLIAGEVAPSRGTIRAPGLVIACQQRTDDPPPGFDAFLDASDSDAFMQRGRLRVAADWLDRWDTLSHGERKRAQIGAALWRDPAVLLLDEPTNHIDADAQELLAGALRTFRGIGLLVSHDRDLLDRFCSQCLFVEPPSVIMRPGAYTEAVEQARADEQHVRDEWDRAKQAYQAVRRQVQERREVAGRAGRMRSKAGLARADYDSRAKIDAARVSGADGHAGRLITQLDGKVRQAEQALVQISLKKAWRTGIWLPGARSPRDFLFHLPSGQLPLGEGRRLAYPEIYMAPTDRVAVTGPNGGGKSTLVRHIIERLSVPTEGLTYVPQEIDAATARRILAETLELPAEALGKVMTVVSCLGSRPERLLDSAEPSPGELRKLLLALGISRVPHLIVMDEPTNHLDLPAIECLEDALDDCPCGLLLVSHDLRFLDHLTRIRWHIAPEDGQARAMRLKFRQGGADWEGPER